MSVMASFIDAEDVMRGWVNGLTGANGLVGVGNPLALGAHLHRLRSPFRGSYALLSTVGSPDSLTEERVTFSCRVSASIYGITKENAAQAALAYANRLLTLSQLHPVVDGVQLAAADGITGPLYLPDTEERYMVDADIYFCLTVPLTV